MHSRGSPLLKTEPDAPRTPPRLRAHWLLFGCLARAIAGLDLWTKHPVFDVLKVKIVEVELENGVKRMAVEHHQHYQIIPGFFELEANINYGAFSGWFHQHTGFLSLLSLLALVVVLWFLWGHLRGP